VTMRKTGLAAMAAFAFAASACGSAATPSPTAAPTAAPTSGPTATAAPTDEPWVGQWNDLIAAAKAEGEVVFIGGPEGSQLDGDWYNAFGDEFGIKATITGGPTGETTARILAERAQGVYSIDVASLGGTGTRNFLEAGIFDELDPLIFHPEALDRSTGWAVDHPVYTEEAAVGICQYVAVQAEPNLITFWYNTDKVSLAEFDQVDSWFDLLKPEWKDRIVIGNVEAGEADRDAATMWDILGQDWWDQLLDPNLGVTVLPYGDERTYADGLIRGEWAIGLFPPGAASLEEAADAQLPVSVWDKTMTEGYLRQGIQRLCVMKDRPHPAGAQLFANWALTKAGQTAFNEYSNRTDRASLRNDVPQGKRDNDTWNRARNQNNPYVDDVNPAFDAARAEFRAYITAKFAELGIVPGG
jgi:iron(III) transport system substrate-binding protein